MNRKGTAMPENVSPFEEDIFGQLVICAEVITQKMRVVN